MNYIGIDPGQSGGMALLDRAGFLCDVIAFKDKTETDICDTLREWLGNDKNAVACLEAVHSMKRDGTVGAFSFGQSYGFLRGILTALQCQWLAVSPQKWKKEFGLIIKGQKEETQTSKKNRDKAEAQRNWPERKWTHAISDAALIAEYCRRTNL
jgi:crossover junction endodeoxyribonuclease RuvC